jgi:hypothetical protein
MSHIEFRDDAHVCFFYEGPAENGSPAARHS